MEQLKFVTQDYHKDFYGEFLIRFFYKHEARTDFVFSSSFGVGGTSRTRGRLPQSGSSWE